MGMRATKGRPLGFEAGALVLLALMGCDSGGQAPPPPALAGEITVDEARIWYQTIGVGSPVVVVHGGPGLDHSYLVPGLEPLAEANRLILYDQRGLGSSSVPLDTTTITMTRFLDDIDALRDQVAGTERVTLLAHSWGAIPALLYAMRWPQRVDGIVLMSPVEPGQRYADQTNEAQAAKRRPEDVAAMDSIAATQAFQQGVTNAVNRLFFHVFRGTFADPAVADSVFSPDFAPRTARQGRIVASILMTPLAGLDFWDQLPDLAVPILIVHGTEDPIPLAMAREMASALPNARLVEIAGAGHFPFIEQPGQTFEAIESFLRERATTQ
ncbi:MAG: alpha/beta fold hydrolase [Gemmatimonadota bacterium]|nr:alpha/beta fold hydrolase [Gemmatimonadota bacterium]